MLEAENEAEGRDWLRAMLQASGVSLTQSLLRPPRLREASEAKARDSGVHAESDFWRSRAGRDDTSSASYQFGDVTRWVHRALRDAVPGRTSQANIDSPRPPVATDETFAAALIIQRWRDCKQCKQSKQCKQDSKRLQGNPNGGQECTLAERLPRVVAAVLVQQRWRAFSLAKRVRERTGIAIIDKAGYLWKAGQYNTEFKRRWVELLGGTLRYRVAPDSAASRGSINVRGASIAIIAQPRPRSRSSAATPPRTSNAGSSDEAGADALSPRVEAASRVRIEILPRRGTRQRGLNIGLLNQAYVLEADTPEEGAAWYAALLDAADAG